VSLTPLAGYSRPLAGCALESLNRACYFITLARAALRAGLKLQVQQPDLFALIKERFPHLFASRPVFTTQAQRARVAQVIRTVESVAALPGYREAAREGVEPAVRAVFQAGRRLRQPSPIAATSSRGGSGRRSWPAITWSRRSSPPASASSPSSCRCRR